jgi:RNA polymerase sigma factor (sigma-70 family)
MPPPVPEQLNRTIETLYRAESGRVLAILVRLLGDLDLAEEAMHEAFAAALESWPQTGIPEMPRPWLISTGRFKAIDVIRRRVRFDRSQKDLALHMEARINQASLDDEEIEDDRLRLIFTCCHPALPPEGQVALTLREICGLTTEEIARAFLVTPATAAETALTLYWKNGKVATTDGPYAETKEQLGGILILEARDMNHAHQLISQHPSLKYGAIFEIRPAGDLNEMLKASEQRRRQKAAR